MSPQLAGGQKMGGARKLKSLDNQDWAEAQAALAAAQAMPGGPERIEALKRAGRMRFHATQAFALETTSAEPPSQG